MFDSTDFSCMRTACTLHARVLHARVTRTIMACSMQPLGTAGICSVHDMVSASFDMCGALGAMLSVKYSSHHAPMHLHGYMQAETSIKQGKIGT